ncbi:MULTISPECIES: hypothetical protein, partial [unclassified Caballeronia]|uniref:hypothetical protein n=1 Tax=unclassified Caballeronia TaxID=2646786 RepID=UPI0028602F89
GDDWGRVAYRYDKQGRLTTLNNENHESTEFRYDTLGQVIEQTGFDGRSVAYAWDDAGRLAASTEAGVETRYERDPMGRLTARTSASKRPRVFTTTRAGGSRPPRPLAARPACTTTMRTT